MDRFLLECARERRVTALHADDGEGVLFAHQIVRALLTTHCEIEKLEVVALEALVGRARSGARQWSGGGGRGEGGD